LWLAVDSNIASIMPAELARGMGPCCLSRRRFLFHATECGVFAWRKKESHSKPLVSGIQLEKETLTNSFRCGIAISSVHLRTRLKVLTQSMRRELNSGEAVGEHSRSTFKNWDSDGFDRQPS
jgi:hypothetical protein